MLLAELAYKSGRTVYILAPRQVAAYRKALGRRAKNDKLDAKLISEFVPANIGQLHAFKPWDEPWKEIRTTVRLRTRLAKDRARIALRMRALGCSSRDIVKTTKSLKDKLRELDRTIAAHLKELPESKAVMSPKGIGPQTAIATIAVLKQVPFKDAKAFVAYLGLDLVVQDSATFKGKRRVSSWGDVTLRILYYLAGKSAAQRPEWSDYVDQLKARGMKPIQIHCAVARRLARIAYRLYHSGEEFDSQKACKPKPGAPPRLAKQT